MKVIKVTANSQKTFKMTLLALALSLITSACTKQVQQESAQENTASTNNQKNSQQNSTQQTRVNNTKPSSHSNNTAVQPMTEVEHLRMEPATTSGTKIIYKQKSRKIDYVAAPTFAASQPQLDRYSQLPEQSAENYQQHKTNPVFMTQNNPVSTFSIDVDTASYSNVRRMLNLGPVSYTHLRAHETCADLVCRLLLEKKK